MKVITITVSGKETAGDIVTLYYRAKRGGQTETAYIVKEGDPLSVIAQQLAFGINTNFCKPLFDAHAKGEEITIMVADGADDVTFGWYVEHITGDNHLHRAPGGTEIVEISEG